MYSHGWTKDHGEWDIVKSSSIMPIWYNINCEIGRHSTINLDFISMHFSLYLGRVLFELADCSVALEYRRYQRSVASEESMVSVSEDTRTISRQCESSDKWWQRQHICLLRQVPQSRVRCTLRSNAFSSLNALKSNQQLTRVLCRSIISHFFSTEQVHLSSRVHLT